MLSLNGKVYSFSLHNVIQPWFLNCPILILGHQQSEQRVDTNTQRWLKKSFYEPETWRAFLVSEKPQVIPSQTFPEIMEIGVY